MGKPLTTPNPMPNQPKAEATPRPWTFNRVKTSSGQCFKLGSPDQVNGHYGAICIYDDSTSLNPRKRGNAEADAALIVKAVNEYDALNAVAEAAKGLKANIPDFDCIKGIPALWDALAALATLRKQ